MLRAWLNQIRLLGSSIALSMLQTIIEIKHYILRIKSNERNKILKKRTNIDTIHPEKLDYGTLAPKDQICGAFLPIAIQLCDYVPQ